MNVIALKSLSATDIIFHLLNNITFALHILIINIVLGIAFILLFKIFKKDILPINPLRTVAPTALAFGINLGVAPLLFIQIIYGYYFYTSSILIAGYWMLIIPCLIIAYYSLYIIAKQDNELLLKAASLTSVIMILSIAFIYVNNMTLMIQPDKWNAYFANRSGFMLNLAEPSLLPRYLHFVVASAAAGGLASAVFFAISKKADVRDSRCAAGLMIFGSATAVQILVGLWYLFSLPQNHFDALTRGNIAYSVILYSAMFCAVCAVACAYAKKLYPALIFFLATFILMIITRFNLRSLYLNGFVDALMPQSTGQTGMMTLFFVVFVFGIGVIWYMVRMIYGKEHGRLV